MEGWKIKRKRKKCVCFAKKKKGGGRPSYMQCVGNLSKSSIYQKEEIERKKKTCVCMYEKQKKEEKKNAYWGGWLDRWMVGWLHAMRLENDIQIMRVSLNKLRYFFFFELINQSKRKKRRKKECGVVCVWCGRQDVSLHYFIREQTQSRGKKKKEDVKKMCDQKKKGEGERSLLRKMIARFFFVSDVFECKKSNEGTEQKKVPSINLRNEKNQ